MKPYERLLKYAEINTASDEDCTATPSSSRQFELAKLLVKELRELGIADAHVTDDCYVYAHIPASPGCEAFTPIGFIAHMDTVSDFCESAPRPVITPAYGGGELALGESGRVLSPQMFPDLVRLTGRTLITSDGTTILGADDKAGIAEIMTMAEILMKENGSDPRDDTPCPKHGPVSIAFTPDEEIGRGADHFDLAEFGARYAYTVDGGEEGELSYETFNAAVAHVFLSGVNVHTGTVKGIMLNAQRLAMEYDALLPQDERPESTDKREGFFHLSSMEGNVGAAELIYLIRDFEEEGFEQRMTAMHEAAEKLNEKYRAYRTPSQSEPASASDALSDTADTEVASDAAADTEVALDAAADTEVARVDIILQYKNMKQIIEKHPAVVAKAEQAIRAAGVTPRIEPVRGGTDGSRLSFMGLPCPNLGTGGHAFHGPHEHISIEGMDSTVDILLAIVSGFAE